uniref:Mediator of RNA polymerase II transcription subunit 16-like isoform X2 n=1 Tax=Nicotiana sylvestris TaxID=4096 RepID=A0A1U7YLD8_NICSY|nr:PREDICTED: mediator of RNA polymerase II transcription subunit 16-like isoform X2 [Nicotiana sylvestris]
MNNQQPPAPPPVAVKDSEEESSSAITTTNSLEASIKVQDKPDTGEDDHPGAAIVTTEKEVSSVDNDDPMDEDSVNPATVFCIRLKQPRSNLLHKMSVPELCRNFRDFF